MGRIEAERARTIYAVQRDGSLAPMRSHVFEAEDDLQRLIADHPSLLAGEDMNPERPRRWILVSREAGVPDAELATDRWYVDHLFLDQDGVPTLVEIKRATDTRIRREVVGQMLDYAANAVAHWPVSTIRTEFERTSDAGGVDADQAIADLLGTEDDPEAFWDRVKLNLQAGRIRLVFIADEMPMELRRVVEFLSAQMDPAEVFAVEVSRFSGDDLTTLVPRIVGETRGASRSRAASGPQRRWDEARFFAELESRDRAAVPPARALLAWANRQELRLTWGAGRQDGSMSPMLDARDEPHRTFAVWTYGVVEVQFQWMISHGPFSSPERRNDLRNRLNQIPSVQIAEDGIDRRPSIPLSVLHDDGNLSQFTAAFDWYLNEIRS